MNIFCLMLFITPCVLFKLNKMWSTTPVNSLINECKIGNSLRKSPKFYYIQNQLKYHEYMMNYYKKEL